MARNSRNTRNPRSELFKSLTRLLSGPLVNRRSQTGRRLRRGQLDKYSTDFTSASGKEFKRSKYNSLGNMNTGIVSSHNRAERYVDFDQMEYTPEIASALDIYADEMTTHSALQPMLNVKCSNEEIKALLQSLYHDVLNVEFNLFGWSRSMCKYGDFFLYLDVDDDIGIKSGIGLPIQEVERLEGEDPTNAEYIQYQWNTAGLTLENWQMAHFRILGNDKHAPYGTSVLESARRIWRQLILLEDAMMAYRIVRSPERRVFYVDVGSIPPSEVEQYMQKVMTQMKRSSIVDESTGRVDLRYNPLSVEEDIYIPQRGNTSSRVESLPGGAMTGDIDDVKYLRDKLFSALKVPASYLSRGEGSDEDKTTLAQKDIRFARTIQRLQRSVVSELEKVGIIHLYTLGFRGDDLINFKLQLNNPSKIAELQELEHWDKKFAVAGAATEGFFSRRWVAEHLFCMSDEEFLRNQRELFYDRKFDASLAAVAEAMQEEAAGLGGLGADEGMGDLGGEELGGEDLGGEDLGADLGGEEVPAEEDDVLLATPPGRREDEPSSISKGKAYYPVKPNRKKDGSYKRHIAAKTGANTSDKRKYIPGMTGTGGLGELSKGMFEQQRSNYIEQDLLEESKIHVLSHDVANLIKDLENSELKKK
tara:strand:+ start:3457 stop:5394 length:1938 start_codon:yes stop_codon:yes gene_type:complete